MYHLSICLLWFNFLQKKRGAHATQNSAVEAEKICEDMRAHCQRTMDKECLNPMKKAIHFPYFVSISRRCTLVMLRWVVCIKSNCTFLGWYAAFGVMLAYVFGVIGAVLY